MSGGRARASAPARMPGRALRWELDQRLKGVGQILNVLRRLPLIHRAILRLREETQTNLHSVPVADFMASVERAGFFSADHYLDSVRKDQKIVLARMCEIEDGT